MKDIYARTNNICLVFLTLCMATAALIYMQPVLVPLIFSVFIYTVLTPLVNWVRIKTKVPKGIAVFFSLVGLFLAMSLIVTVLISSLRNFADAIPKYQDSITLILGYVENITTRFDIQVDFEQVKNYLKSSSFLSIAKSTGAYISSVLGNLFLVFIFAIFMMAGESRSTKKGPLVKEILNKVSAYVSSKFSLSLLTGFLVWIVLLLFGIELAFIFALLTVVLNFIPTIGSLIAIVLPLPIVFLQYQFGISFFLVLGLSGAIQFTVGNVIEPKVLGESMDLHPITTLVCLVFWGMVWGVAGWFLAVPITAILKIVFARIEATKGLSEILAGRLPTKA